MAEDHTNENNIIEETINEEELSEQRRIRREKLDALRAAGQDPYRVSRFERTTNSQAVKGTAELMDARVSVAGRIVSRRIMGKASFCHILDEAGSFSSICVGTMWGRRATRALRPWTSETSSG